jgi:hypothetical protein
MISQSMKDSIASQQEQAPHQNALFNEMKQTSQGFTIKAFTPGSQSPPRIRPVKKTEIKRKMELEIKREEQMHGFDTLGKTQPEMSMKLTQILMTSNPTSVVIQDE